MSAMSIDPKILSQLLRLQMMNQVDFFGSSDSSSADDGGLDFSSLLQQLMGQAAGASPSDATASADSLSAALPYRTSSVYARPPIRYADGDENQPNQGAAGYDSYIQEAAARYQVDPALIRSVIQTESSFNPNAVSSAGAKGLMQLMDGTAEGLGVTDSFDPRQNIHGGTKFLSYLLRKYDGNVGTALAAYNAGPGRVDRLGISNDAELRAEYGRLPRETQAYVKRVMKGYT